MNCRWEGDGVCILTRGRCRCTVYGRSVLGCMVERGTGGTKKACELL